jgi:DNA-binding MarR family transcriptional regulator
MTTKQTRQGAQKSGAAHHEHRRTDDATAPTRSRLNTAIDHVLSEGRAQLESSRTVDAIWVDGLTAVVVDTLMSTGSEGVSTLEREIATFDAELRANKGDDIAIAKLELLRRITQLGAQALLPREAARSIEPKTHAANLLLLLEESGCEIFNDVLADQFGLHPTQLSHITNKLTSQGLVQRTKYGRRASWSLTPAGELAAEQIRERDSSAIPDDAVTASTPAEFEDAVHRSVDALEIDTPNAEDAWYVRATLGRMSGTDVFGSTYLPSVLFPSSIEDAAYIRSDLAKTLVRFYRTALRGHGPAIAESGGLVIAGSYVEKTDIDRLDPELEDA